MMFVKGSTKKNVVKALAAGLAVLMTGQPLVAEAAELPKNVNQNENEQNDVQATNVADALQSKADGAGDEIDDAVMSTNSLLNDISGETNGIKSEDVSNAEAINNAAADLGSKNSEGKTLIDIAKDKISDMKDELAAVEETDAIEDISATTTVNCINGMDALADSINSDMDSAVTNADALADLVVESSTEAEAVIALNDLKSLAATAQDNLTEAKANFTNLEKAYEEAKAALLIAQSNYLSALGQAKDDATEAKNNLDAASAKLAELKTELNVANSEVQVADEKASRIVAAIDAVSSNDTFDKNAEQKVFSKIMKDYYITEVLAAGASDVSDIIIEKNCGIDNDTLNYYTVKYKVDGVSYEKYYNFAVEEGTTNSIVIFEKDNSERAINDQLRIVLNQKYGNNPTKEQISDIIENYGVYSMTWNGNTYFTAMKKSSASPSYTLLVNDANNNSEYFLAGNGLVQSSDAGLAAYINKVSSYNNMVKKVASAQSQVDAAKAAAEELENKMDDIKEAANTVTISDVQVKNMLIALVSQYNDSTDFSNLSIDDLMNQLETILTSSKQKLSEAEDKLATVQNQLARAQSSYARFVSFDEEINSLSMDDNEIEVLLEQAGIENIEKSVEEKNVENLVIGSETVEANTYSSRLDEKSQTDKYISISSEELAKAESVDRAEGIKEDNALISAESEEKKESNLAWMLVCAAFGNLGAGIFVRHNKKIKEEEL